MDTDMMDGITKAMMDYPLVTHLVSLKPDWVIIITVIITQQEYSGAI